MSDVDEYEIRKGDMTLQEMHRADAAIAELATENAGFERGARLDRDEIEALRAEMERLKGIAERQATILRGLMEWAETLPEQARDVGRKADGWS